jgi:hypothetical protein
MAIFGLGPDVGAGKIDITPLHTARGLRDLSSVAGQLAAKTKTPGSWSRASETVVLVRLGS